MRALAQTGSTIGGHWTGYTGEGDYKSSAGNTEEFVTNAHAVRDGKYDTLPPEVIETGEVYDCVIAGGGFAGLSAALLFQKRTGAKRNCPVLDNAEIFGGVAMRIEFLVNVRAFFGGDLRCYGIGLECFQVLPAMTLSLDAGSVNRENSSLSCGSRALTIGPSAASQYRGVAVEPQFRLLPALAMETDAVLLEYRSHPNRVKRPGGARACGPSPTSSRRQWPSAGLNSIITSVITTTQTRQTGSDSRDR